MKTISMDQFVVFMSQALPEIMASVMREDRGAVSMGKMTLPQFWVLYHIDRAGEVTLKELSVRLQRSKSTVSVLVNRLVERKLVERRPNVSDRRQVGLSLTREGAVLMRELEENRLAGVRRTYRVFSPEERAVYESLVGKLLAHVRKISVWVILFLLGSHVAFAGEVKSYSLKRCVELGLKRSLLVMSAKRERLVANEKRREAFSSALPQVRGVADYFLYDDANITESGSARVGAEASWQLFSGGRTASALRAARAYEHLTADQERQIKAAQVRDIAFAYYRVQLAAAQVKVLEASVAQLSDFEADARKKFKAGTASEFDWLSAKVSLANERPALIAAKNRLSLARAVFRKRTFIEDADFVLSDPLVFVPMRVKLSDMIEKGVLSRPELLVKQSSIDLRREEVKQERSSYYPRLDLVGTYNVNDPDPYGFMPGNSDEGWQNHWSAGVRATWDLFDGGRRRARVSASKLKMAIEEDQYVDLRRSIKLEIQTYWLRGRDSAEVIRASVENIKLAERALAIARARFDAGLGTNLEVTQANVELSRAKLARLAALHDYMRAVIGLKYSVGRLLKEFEDE